MTATSHAIVGKPPTNRILLDQALRINHILNVDYGAGMMARMNSGRAIQGSLFAAMPAPLVAELQKFEFDRIGPE